MVAEAGWTEKRITRLGFLVGKGRNAAQIAIELGTSQNSVYIQASRLGLRFRDVQDELTVELSPMASAAFTFASTRRNITPAVLLKRVVELCAAEPSLLENILDDA